MIRLTFNPKLVLWTTWPCFKQVKPTWERDSIGKPALGQRSTSQKHVTSMSSQLELAIWPRNTGQWIPWIDRCQLSITWISNIKEVHVKPRLQVWYIWCLAAMLRDFVAVVIVVVRTRPRAIPLAMITMRKSTHGFPFLSHVEYGAPLGSPSGRRSSAINACTFPRYDMWIIKCRNVRLLTE